jgi:hypothetical protein
MKKHFSRSFDNSIVKTQENKLFCQLPKQSERLKKWRITFIYTSKSIRNSKIGELGLSYMGAFIKFQDEGIILDKKNDVSYL